MNVTVKFLGGARTVTGSKFLLEIDGFAILVDCGLFQGMKKLRLRNWDDFPYPVDKIDAVIITHSHIDHTGYLPRLVKEGFAGPIYCTDATQDLMTIMLKDSAKLQEEEAEWARKKGYSKHTAPQPLYTVKDVEKALDMLIAFPFHEEVEVTENIKLKFANAGHIIGAALVELQLRGDEQTKKIVFSGDLGRYDDPILYDPEKLEDADILFIESTYGGRNNDWGNPIEKLKEVVLETMDRGCLLIPSFTVGRTQLLLFLLKELLAAKEIPDVPIFIDSPMAINVTGLYTRHPSYHKLKPNEVTGRTVFDYPNIHYIRESIDSKKLNNIIEGAIIISASGMCTGGRILHHLYNRLPRANDTVLFVGYQAVETRGSRIIAGEPEIKIFGEQVKVKSKIRQIDGLSAHADQKELLRWAGGFKASPKKTFIIHGEPESAFSLAHNLRQDLQWNNIYVPDYLESFELFEAI
ncbi:MAG: MBL fold metallo-hydrolase [Bacteroidota bacterium]